jgi:hypothetical protein
MALNGDALGLAMLAAMDAYVATLPDPKEDNYNRADGFKELGKAIVAYIIANAIVTSNVVVTSVSGVTTGPGVSGPGTGTATGTIS